MQVRARVLLDSDPRASQSAQEMERRANGSKKRFVSYSKLSPES